MSISTHLTKKSFTYFAEHLGFKGVDSDLFYESYYQLDNNDYEGDYENDN